MQQVITTTPFSLYLPSSVLFPFLVTLTYVEYDSLRHTNDTGAFSSISLASLPPPSTSSMHALFVSSLSSWIIDLRDSTHTTGTPTLLSFYQPSTTLLLVTNIDVQPCLVNSHGTTITTSSLPLRQVFYVPRFLANRLSISAITRALFCYVILFPCHCTFQVFITVVIMITYDNM